MLDARRTPEEQPDDIRKNIRKLREVLQQQFPDRDIGRMNSMEVVSQAGNINLTPIERKYVHAWQKLAQDRPDITFDEFVEYLAVMVRHAVGKRKDHMRQETMDTSSGPRHETVVMPEETQQRIFREGQTVRRYLGRLFRSFFKGDE